jgi:hypothetical protein
MKGNMGKETIDAAILAHRGWVSRFKTAFDGINTEHFEMAETVDASACDLGWWLLENVSRQQLGPESHDQIQALHARFHHLCGVLASQLNQRLVGQDHEVSLVELDAISKNIVNLLLQARDKQE